MSRASSGVQTDLDEPWFEQTEYDDIEIVVGIIDGDEEFARSHAIPKPFLAEEFSSRDGMIAFVESQMQDLGMDVLSEWGETA